MTPDDIPRLSATALHCLPVAFSIVTIEARRERGLTNTHLPADINVSRVAVVTFALAAALLEEADRVRNLILYPNESRQ